MQPARDTSPEHPTATHSSPIHSPPELRSSQSDPVSLLPLSTTPSAMPDRQKDSMGRTHRKNCKALALHWLLLRGTRRVLYVARTPIQLWPQLLAECSATVPLGLAQLANVVTRVQDSVLPASGTMPSLLCGRMGCIRHASSGSQLLEEVVSRMGGRRVAPFHLNGEGRTCGGCHQVADEYVYLL